MSLTRIALATLVLAAAPVFASPLNGALDCAATIGQDALTWQINLDDEVPLATLNDHDLPARYSPAHVEIHLENGGPTLMIGRQSGRLLLAAADGRSLATGTCRSVRTS